MTSWMPNLKGRKGPLYQAIVTALAEDLAAGRLREGDRLPTHRDLAEALGVTVGTVTRAYAEAHRRRLVSGEVGRGTFVRRAEEVFGSWHPNSGEASEEIDLTRALPVASIAPEEYAEALRAVAAQPGLMGLLGYQPEAGMPAHRAAIAAWVARAGLADDPARVVITSGAEHAISCVFGALLQPKDTVVTEALTYPTVKALAAMQHVHLAGVEMDGDGLIPDALEAACRRGSVRVLYCIPTLHNPTSAVMPLRRRQEIVEIARRHDLAIVEDDIFGFLEPEAPPPLAVLAPERTYYVSSFSKLAAPGLRVGYVVAPATGAARVANAVFASLIMVAPVLVETAAHLVRNGTARRQMDRQREEAAVRGRILAETLAGAEVVTRPTSVVAWLRLPPPWGAEDFALQAHVRGVAVTPAAKFHVGRGAAPEAVRIALGGVSRESLRRGLASLAELVRGGPDAARGIV
jgi:DNA-binding transcriptional MocR family regulator